MGGAIQIGRRKFADPSKAARALGLSTSAVYKAAREGRLPSVGKSGNYPGNARSVNLFGHEWGSRALCCADLGCSEPTLRTVLSGEASSQQEDNMRRRVEAWAANQRRLRK